MEAAVSANRHKPRRGGSLVMGTQPTVRLAQATQKLNQFLGTESTGSPNACWWRCLFGQSVPNVDVSMAPLDQQVGGLQCFFLDIKRLQTLQQTVVVLIQPSVP
jgi:hypothetical protein